MTEHPRTPDPDDVPTPRWVKVFVAIFVLFLLIFVALHLTGRGLGNHA